MGERVGQQQKASTQPHLSGWALIKEHMLKFDDGTVKNLNDDINALPTFAGLFSTVVTGFIIEFYKTLPREDSDPQITNMVLKHISQQLGHISQQMANSTFPPIPLTTGSDDFHSSISPTTTVWIISFWFFSLVLSLAAALFGMMAKSWLREYSQWTTMSGPPEETVRLRQGRYEAFESWKTPAIIASLPALLEASFVLFLIGMEILLWTLDDIVFGACTAAVGVLIVLVIVATLLPAFRTQCPYRSPMAWTFLLAKAALLSVWYQAPDSSGKKRSDIEKNDSLAQERSSSRVMVKKNWREQDLYMQRSSLGSTRDWNDDDFAAAGRLYTLIRALLWIMETSQDRRLLTAVDECITDTRMHVFRHPFGRLI